MTLLKPVIIVNMNIQRNIIVVLSNKTILIISRSTNSIRSVGLKRRLAYRSFTIILMLIGLTADEHGKRQN